MFTSARDIAFRRLRAFPEDEGCAFDGLLGHL